MMNQITALNQWMNPSQLQKENVEGRCTQAFMEHSIQEFAHISVQEVSLIETTPQHVHVILQENALGNRPVTINVFLPLQWNGRYCGCLGGGTRTLHLYEVLGRQNRIAMPFSLLANGFATANTDGGVFTWDSGAVDFELIQNMAFRSAYTMTLVAKKMIQSFYGKPAAYCYLQGASGGGRVAMSEAQLHPEEYDGIWAADPAINWSEVFASFLWPLTVMNEEKHVLSYAKLEAYHHCLTLECLNLNDGLTDESGNLKAEFTVEGMHLHANGYKIILDNLLPTLKSL